MIKELASALACSVCIVAIALPASAQTRTYDIPTGSLKSALDAYGRQSGRPIIYQADQVRGVRSAGYRGVASTQAALDAILKGTGFIAREDNSGAIAIVRASKSASLSGEGVTVAEPVPEGAVPDIIVTAQKRTERLQDVPISVAVVSGDEIAARKINTIDDLRYAVPGLSIQDSAVNRRIALRGIANIVGVASTVGIYLDEASVTASAGTQLNLRTYDLDRVEVLRGPQGTLYGEGSVGGTIRFITKEPELNKFGLEADVDALFTQDGAPSQRIEAVVNVPLVTGTLGLRVAGTFDHEGGWVDQPAIGAKDFNQQNATDVRVKALWNVLLGLKIHATVVVHRDEADPNFGEDANGNYTQVGGILTTPRRVENFEIYNLTGSYDFSGVRLLTSTSYLHQNFALDHVGNSLPLFGPPGVVPDYQQYYGQNSSTKSVSEEVRLSSNNFGKLQWTAGLFYRHFRYSYFYPYLNGGQGAPLTPFGSFGPYITDADSISGFGNASFKLGRLTIGAGVRYFDEHQQYRASYSDKAHFHSLDPRFYADLAVTRDLNLYASAAKGFRSGGFNSLNQAKFEPESVWTYDAGIKGAFLNRHVRVDVSVFLSNYDNYQVSGINLNDLTGGATVTNAGDARIKGVEWSVSTAPLAGWSVGFSGNYLDTRFTRVDLKPGSAAYAVGDPVDYIPKYQITAMLQHDFTISGKSGFIRIDYSRLGRSNYRNRSYGYPYYSTMAVPDWYHSTSDVIDTLNLNARLTVREGMTVGVFAENLLNDRGYTSPVVIEENANRQRPRTFGVSFSVKSN